MSVTKLSLAQRLILLHLHSGMDGDVIVIHGHRNVIVCRIADRSPPPPRSHAIMAQRMKTVQNLAIRCHRSVNQSLGYTGQM
jgi:hypothetical protein